MEWEADALFQVLWVNQMLQQRQSCKSKYSSNQLLEATSFPPATQATVTQGTSQRVEHHVVAPRVLSCLSTFSRAVGKEPGPRVSDAVRTPWQEVEEEAPPESSEPTWLHRPACGSPRATYLRVYDFQQNIKWKSRY